ncbi:uncharacterized protein [Prorops nasuta]|uniref:uncharacterized protein isoform X2 n=1 Tax=Prorops nasuta TaxID=863751 RepID=UPI0034CE8EEA
MKILKTLHCDLLAAVSKSGSRRTKRELKRRNAIRPRRRGSGVTDIHPQQQQQQGLGENNNSSSREGKKVQEVVGPDEMWAPESLGHHRELPVDVPDTLLQKAYPNKVTNRSSQGHSELRHSRSASDFFNLSSLKLRNETPKKVSADSERPVPQARLTDTTNIRNGRGPVQLQQLDDRSIDRQSFDPRSSEKAQETTSFIERIDIGKQDTRYSEDLKENGLHSKHLETFKGKLPREAVDPEKVRDSSLQKADKERVDPCVESNGPSREVDEADGSPKDLTVQRESSFDVEDDYPFAKEDYPTMLKTCSDDSTSPRSSSGRSDSTAPLDSTLLLGPANNRKDAPVYETRRIDLGSPCRSLATDIKIPPFFTHDATYFDNPAYVLTDIQDIQNLILRSSDHLELAKYMDDQKKQKDSSSSGPDKSSRSSKRRRDKLARLKAKSKSLDAEELIALGSMDDLLGDPDRSLTSSSRRRKKKKPQQFCSGYSTLRSEVWGDLELTDRSFLVVGSKSFREVAVDCPEDFVPVTKCHPVYPPPIRVNDRAGSKLDDSLETKFTFCDTKHPEESKETGVDRENPREQFDQENHENLKDVVVRKVDEEKEEEEEEEEAVKTLTENGNRVGRAALDSSTSRDHRTVVDRSSFTALAEDSVKALNVDDKGSMVSVVARTGQKHEAKKIGLNGVKPAIPPRDQKRAPARPPKDNIRLSSQNNNLEQDATSLEPTQQQLHSIKKYQEQLRKRKDEEERQEILNRSLRDSRKLHALQSNSRSCPSGVENPAYAQDEVTAGGSTVVQVGVNHAAKEVEEPPKALTFGEVVATVERLQLQLRNLSGALGISGQSVEAELKAVQTLLVQNQFATALTTHHLLRGRLRSGKTLKHHADDASSLARDCVDTLEKWQSSAPTTCASTAETITAVEELTSILTSYDMEALLLAHDLVATYVDGLQRKHSTSSSSPSGPPSPTSSWKGSRFVDNIKIIRIEKTNEPLGATVRNEGDAVIIGRVVRGGAADKSGLLHEGDEVLEVNGQEMRGKSVNEVCDILAGMQGSLTFLVLPAPQTHRNNMQNRRDDTLQIQHIRAHFDYDPEEDPYIPCRELGVRFEKGDVLHVISQEDPNWWQAYKEGEEDQTLAGLIPSKAFQHQRESTKQTIAGDNSTVRGAKKSSTLLCARKNPKKKKRSKFGSNYTDDNYPIYSTPAVDDYDNDEVLTYEEVALYYPRADHKRPIVLIGPPNIGRHELRQRLMQNSERFAAAIPHTSRPRKENEIDGQDYHFISRAQFEADILCRKFVEHGEYEKAYYGTSIEAIRAVVDARKICVLNLHPQSLKILRNSDLKPYVVFVGPPSLEKLKQKRIKNNESFKEEELKDIIEKAREMDDKYGHLFDMIIINNDTDWAYNQLLAEINSLEREPQWVPAHWVD